MSSISISEMTPALSSEFPDKPSLCVKRADVAKMSEYEKMEWQDGNYGKCCLYGLGSRAAHIGYAAENVPVNIAFSTLECIEACAFGAFGLGAGMASCACLPIEHGSCSENTKRRAGKACSVAGDLLCSAGLKCADAASTGVRLPANALFPEALSMSESCNQYQLDLKLVNKEEELGEKKKDRYIHVCC